ncbi:RyR domain-containing protein [Actinoplanes sp. NPDC026619]|uniref:RyR domain-containing protein n=1 Tax=Actinoplanes sp. NPDC026619 TaxID=3155798 RepID=UPI0033CFED0C
MLFPAIAITAALLGYFGMSALLAGQTEYANDLWDRLYYTAQLFVLGSPPLDNGGSMPPFLQVARFLAPAVTIYAVIEAVRLLFAAELVRLRARRSHDHVIVSGDGPVADALTARLADQGRRVVRVVRPEERAAGRRRQLLVPGDSSRSDLLRGTGIKRAETLYVCSDDTARNLSVVLAVTELPRRVPLRVHVQIDDPELCLALQARRLGRREQDRLNVNFFNWHEQAAHALLTARRPPIHPDRSTRVMVVGMSWFARALIVELSRAWRLHHPAAALEVILVDAGATAAIRRLRRLYPFIDEVCRFTARDQDVPMLLDGDLPDAPPDRVYICCDDEEVGLKLALTMDHFWRAGPQSVIVRLGRLGRLRQAFHGPGERLLDPVSGTLDMFDALRAGTDVGLAEDSLNERLAKAIHDRYLLQQVRSGVAFGAAPAMREWGELTEPLRAGNRAQATDIGPKLYEVGCALAPNPVWGEPLTLTDGMIEQLARREHQRWCAFMCEAGWNGAGARDEIAKEHPDLIDWDQLPESTREKDRDTVRQLPELLADAGFRIVRVRHVVEDGNPTVDF